MSQDRQLAEYKGKGFTWVSGPRLGQGGMANVYLGTRSDKPDVYAALKVPRGDLTPETQSLFLREVQSAQRVAHPNVVRLVDWGDDPAFIAFEFVGGGTVAEDLRERQATKAFWPEAELIGVFRQLVEGMTAINAELVHRDLKPENIFLDGITPKIGDFGIAKYAEEVTRTKTFKGWGSPHYMAPEAFRGESVDWRSDQYALGVVFYELAALQRPFDAGDWDELERRHLYERPPRALITNAGYSERLATLVMRMLEKRPEHRFQSWESVLSDLDALREKGLSAEGRSNNPLASRAAEQVESVRRVRLEQQRIQEEERLNQRSREELLAFWADEFLQQVRTAVEAVNESLGENVITFKQDSSRKDLRCEVDFIHSRLRIFLWTIPVESSKDMLAWGIINLSTNNRIWITNLLLDAQPTPYGAWQEVDMRVSAFIAGAHRPIDDVGGQYEVVGRDRLVLAKNLQALLHQRGMRQVMSSVSYEQKPLDFKLVLDEIMAILVEDANFEVTTPEHRRGTRRQMRDL